MNIVFIASRDLKKIGGIESYMNNLCTNLAENGHDVHLYCEGEKYSKFTYNGFEIISFKSLKNKFLNKLVLGFTATIHSLVFNRNTDIYHYNAIPSAFSSWIPRLLLKEVIYQGHGFEWQRTKWKPYQQKIIRFLEELTVRINKNITMVSQDQTDFIKKHYKKNAVTITPAINLPDGREFETNILETYSLKKNEYILFLGRLVEEKNPDLLISAFKKCALEKTKLVIAGDDLRSRRYIQNLKNSADNHPNIVFTGAVYGEDKEMLLRYCEAFCIPSTLEGLPIALLEAMSFKRFCIASDIPACKEALGDTGVFFNNKDEEDLVRKLNSIPKYKTQEFGYKAFDRVRNNFTWGIITQQYIEYCSIILNKKN